MSTIIIILGSIIAVACISIIAWIIKNRKKKIINTSGLQRSPLPTPKKNFLALNTPHTIYSNTNNHLTNTQNKPLIMYNSRDWQGPFPNGNLTVNKLSNKSHKPQVIPQNTLKYQFNEPQVTPQITSQHKPFEPPAVPSRKNRPNISKYI
jgi:hypothetical protein